MSPFAGIDTLAGLAAITIDGTKPFWFLIDDGRRTGPVCTPGSRTNCFTSVTGAYRLRDADVPHLDIAWLAIEAALMTGHAYIPAILASASNDTGYEIGTARPLPLMIPMTPEADANHLTLGVTMRGDGPRRSVLFAGSSFGTLDDGVTVIPLLTCGDPGATPRNGLGRWAGGAGQCAADIRDIGLWGSQVRAQGWSSDYRTDGIAIGPRMQTDNVTASWFYHDATIIGDHVLHKQLHLLQGVYGLLWPPPNPVLVGDLQFQDLVVAGQSIAAMVVDGHASVAGQFAGETYLNAQGYDFDGLANGCQAIIGGATFDNLMTEFQGLGVAEDEHNFDRETARYDDSAKCRAISALRINQWFMDYVNDRFPSHSRRVRRATWDAATISGSIDNISVNGGSPFPVAGLAGASGIAVFNVNGIGTPGDGLGFSLGGELVGHMFELGQGKGIDGATIPIFSPGACGGTGLCPITWHQLDGETGTFTMLRTAGNYRSTTFGDVLEAMPASLGVSMPGGTSASAPIAGIVEQTGLPGGAIVPIETAGDAFVATGDKKGISGYAVKNTSIGAVRFTAGTGGIRGTYIVTATAGCEVEPVFDVMVGAQGHIVAVSLHGSQTRARCSSSPSVPVPPSAGLTGASIQVTWPAADAVEETDHLSQQSDRVEIGFGWQRSMTSQTGSALSLVRLRLQ
ncbi:MAG: hypothetical protein ACRYG8_24835 [Janthinobacterium lividum]